MRDTCLLRKLYDDFTDLTLYGNPPVLRLDVHLEIQHTLYFAHGLEEQVQHELEEVQSLPNCSKQIRNMRVRDIL